MRPLRDDNTRLLLSGAAAITLHLGIFATMEFGLPASAPSESSAIRVQLEMRTVENVDRRLVEAAPPESMQSDHMRSESAPTDEPPDAEPRPPTQSPTPIEEPPPTEPPPLLEALPKVEPTALVETPLVETPPAERSRIEQSLPSQNMSTGTASSAYEREFAARGSDLFRDTVAPPASPTPSAPELQPERYVEPHYPEAARRGAIEGTVVVHFRVNRRGRVQDPEIRRSSGSDLLDREALRAVRMWRFSRENVGKESVHRIVFRLE